MPSPTAALGPPRHPEGFSPHLIRRRVLFFGLVFVTALAAAGFYGWLLTVEGTSLLDLALIAVYAILALWLSFSFWTLTAGFALNLALLLRPPGPDAPLGPGGRVALIMPVDNEETERLAAGVRAIRDDLRRLGVDGRYDLFILSDSTDPARFLAEIEAWDVEQRRESGSSRLFYRRRTQNLRRKTDNIESWLTRNGGRYEFMLVLDADSLMTAEAIAELTRRIEADPEIGLIQSPPRLVRGESFFARVLQFAGDMTGPLMAAGIGFWAGNSSNYWGHNAIIRVRAFSQSCGLPILPGPAPFGGGILSHDFVEAALLRRHGWKVQIAWDLTGSFEEPPPALPDFAKRDRRRCQGNLQHTKLIFARDLRWVSRLHFATGVLAYLTSPLWLLFLVLSALQAWAIADTPIRYFSGDSPIPDWPVNRQSEALGLLAVMLSLLLVPKLYGALLASVPAPARRARGGVARIAASTLIELVYTSLLAPLMMLLHTGYVAAILSGNVTGRGPQRRRAQQEGWAADLARYGWVSLLGVVASLAVLDLAPALAPWLAPVLAGWVLAPVVARLGASVAAGRALGRFGLLRTVEEGAPPPVLTRLAELEAGPATYQTDGLAPFRRTLLDPAANARLVRLLRDTGEALPVAQPALVQAERRAVHLGLDQLSTEEWRLVLTHPDTLERLHAARWARHLADEAERKALAS